MKNKVKEFTRAINKYDAESCEAAKSKTCHCRCAGLLHGKPHDGYIKAERAALEKSKDHKVTVLQVKRMVSRLYKGAKRK